MTSDLATPESFNLWLTLAPGVVLTAFLLTSWRRALAIPFVLSVACHFGMIWAVREERGNRIRSEDLDVQVFPVVDLEDLTSLAIKKPEDSPTQGADDMPRGTPNPGVAVEAVLQQSSRLIPESLPVMAGPPAALVGLPAPSRERPEIDPLRWKRAEDLDSLIRERLAKLGGKEGALTFTLIWFTKDDLDLQVHDPNGRVVAFFSPDPSDRQKLDVDANRGGDLTEQPIENIRWMASDSPAAGTYHVYIDHYASRSKGPAKFLLRILVNGKLVAFVPGQVSFEKADPQNPELKVYDLNYTPTTP